MLLHAGEKQYKCDKCDISFGISSQYQIHTSKHAGENWHRCNVCGKAFTTTSTTTFLKRHNWHMHIHSVEKPHKCDIYSKCYPVFSSLQQHLTAHSIV